MQACRTGLQGRRAAAERSRRLLSVVAWGRNAEGQCGANDAPLVVEPAELDLLAGSAVSTLAAGSLHSAAVLQDGSVLTWGSGKAGKLGHGVGDNFSRPCRVEALVGRANVAQAALGTSHSLFLDGSGGVWSCGENKEGQCGLGTPLELLARQRRQEWAMGTNLATFAQAFSEVARDHAAAADSQGAMDSGSSSLGHGSGSMPAWQQHSSDHERSSGFPSYLKPFMQHKDREEELERARQMFAGAASMRATGSDSVFGSFPDSGSPFARPSSKGEDGNLAGMLSRMGGLMPGQHHTPMRIGRDLHPLLAAGKAVASSDSGKAAEAAAEQAADSIGSREVAGVAASKYFSVLRSSSGEVWTCGGGFNGELGQPSSWVTSPRQVSGPVREALAENGGAVAVECGATFCVALTSSGRVVVWGSPPGLPQSNSVRRSGGVVAVEVMGLPPMTSIAAGHSHCLMTDGQRVWAMGSWLLSNGKKGGTEWGTPQVVPDLPAGGIVSIAAGARASAAITADGQLWMWGRLMAADNARALMQQTTGLTPTDKDAASWMWEGMGTDGSAVRVPGLSGVRAVQLGSAHVLALLD